MSGIIGSRLNNRGSRLVGSLGTDGQIFTSSGAGKSAVFEAAAGGGAWTKIKEITASSDSDISFVDGTDSVVLDSTYPIYVFKFINIHPSDDRSLFSFQGNAAGGSGYNETMTTTMFRVYNNEAGDDAAGPVYVAGGDQGQGTAFQPITTHVGNDNDENAVGNLWLYNPSDTTYVKHFISQCSANQGQFNYLITSYVTGYFNTTSAIDEIQFKFDAGTIDAGTISLYGIS